MPCQKEGGGRLKPPYNYNPLGKKGYMLYLKPILKTTPFIQTVARCSFQEKKDQWTWQRARSGNVVGRLEGRTFEYIVSCFVQHFFSLPVVFKQARGEGFRGDEPKKKDFAYKHI